MDFDRRRPLSSTLLIQNILSLRKQHKRPYRTSSQYGGYHRPQSFQGWKLQKSGNFQRIGDTEDGNYQNCESITESGTVLMLADMNSPDWSKKLRLDFPILFGIGVFLSARSWIIYLPFVTKDDLGKPILIVSRWDKNASNWASLHSEYENFISLFVCLMDNVHLDFIEFYIGPLAHTDVICPPYNHSFGIASGHQYCISVFRNNTAVFCLSHLVAFTRRVLTPALGPTSLNLSANNYSRLVFVGFVVVWPTPRGGLVGEEKHVPQAELEWFTVGSTSKSGTCPGIVGVRPFRELFVPMGPYPTVLQAEVTAVMECARENLRLRYRIYGSNYGTWSPEEASSHRVGILREEPLCRICDE
ncbi:hypothetical protein J6590_087991 [Homalodisca vitripennis]|nr:hypothetical protein J6590_087991 [Homalodisca vitripennis]